MPKKTSEEKVPEKKSSSQNFIMNKTPFIIIGLILLAGFFIFTFTLVKGGHLNQFDFNMTVKIQDNIPKKFDPYFSVLSLVGSAEVMAVILAIVLIFRKKIMGIFAFAAFCLMHLVELLGKAKLDHPPTPFMFHRYDLNVFFPSSYVQPGGSYPSGHAMRTTFLIVLLLFLVWRSKKIKIELKIALVAAIIIFTFIMFVSRVSLGEHWTSDVIGGFLIGAGACILSLILI